ncbi:PREDICTED: disintegrin and metalloproteinase domain-containing protein 12, partial [Myotis brandtii]|uniref:disintegrin and metalloproteinase domain-containing protein 12 n=1 Tax=Myotis brandtii TaxID=109478 RepID=UPI000704488E
MASLTGRGLTVGRTVAPATLAGTEDGAGAYEVVSASLLDGDFRNPRRSARGENHPEVLTFRIQLESEELIVNLERNEGLIASGFTETHYRQDGTEVALARNHTGHCYYHGHVQGRPGSTASLSTCSGLRGLITFENKSYVLEPMDNVTDRYKLFSAEALKGIWGSCGSHPSTSGPTAGGGRPPPSRTRHKRETLQMTKYVELVIVADNREFQRQGKDLGKVKQRLIEIANHVDKFYRPLNIRIVLVGVEVWNDIDKCPIGQDPFTSLHEFLDWRKAKLLPRKAHDNAQLVSGVYFQGTTIGMAPIMSMCTAEQSGGIVMDHSDSPLGAAVTLAHELGHNFGMNHDTLERGCSCRTAPDKGGCIMNPSTGQLGTMQLRFFAAGLRAAGLRAAGLRAAMQLGSVQLGSVQLGSMQLGSVQLGSVQLGSMQLGSVQLGSVQLGSMQLGSVQLGSVQLGSMQLGSVQLGSVQLGSMQLGSVQLGSVQLGSMQLGSVQLGSVQLGSMQLGSVQLGSMQLGSMQLHWTLFRRVLILEELVCPPGELHRFPQTCCSRGTNEEAFSLELEKPGGLKRLTGTFVCTGRGEGNECTSRCCNASTCTLTPGAVCAHGLCCEHCQLKPAGTACRGERSGEETDKGGAGGWGLGRWHRSRKGGAKPAPGICFERVNSAGDPYGNCGKDAKSSFAKCETRDAKCGKIQCQGGASRPVIGTNAVSIETNIPLQEGGRVLCRGTHVYLGDDMPDPGLVLAGTKCADGKICLNRRCQNISVFGVHECARQCHGRGVCNNRKNCHCEAHWAPPFCDKVGFGGSTDSGPIRQAGHRGLTAGVLASILCLLAAGLAVYLKRKTLVRLLFTDKKTLEKLRCVRPARPPGG